MDGHCKDCKWWTDKFWSQRKDSGMCDRSIQPGSLFEVNSDNEGILYTLPDFGCVQFESKEEA